MGILSYQVQVILFYFFSMVWKNKFEGSDEDCSQIKQLGLLPKCKISKAQRFHNNFKCGRQHVQSVSTTNVVILLFFNSNLCSNLQLATNVHQTMWQLSPTSKTVHVQLTFFALFFCRVLGEKEQAKPTQPGFKTIKRLVLILDFQRQESERT